MGSNKKLAIMILLAFIIIGIGLIIFYTLRPRQNILPISDNLNKSGVIISTNKIEYDKGEIIKIVVNNKLDASILYYSAGDRFWGIEYFKENKWTDLGYKEGGSFQLTEENIGDACYIFQYERISPVELRSGVSISHQWNQKICPFGTTGPSDSKIVEDIKGGQYRFIFTYGFKISSDDPYGLSDFQTIYSNSFTIR